mmetsp:Transcript_22364/g.33319  ORF Transcript_22364/g.33319 Transcript_22364/m.33319 type:complete len:268 (+) Transcript_22364:104-907(+)|eukprot:CAMPEP_0167760180 /NCGR_PEP_ID=MMETSP0110_2-20121227/11444_1 /TAXON_ID=629695 /ORGANISM="Gymnochlora sp., Strain CCMP2014" /LENGTH=267 /DNA_ID=CAMNT_0007646665 /DNA_START=68 /DNA_END=871 /DNA_ORIENTATION=+
MQNQKLKKQIQKFCGEISSDVKLMVDGKESGINIYKTNVDPIDWVDNKVQKKKVVKDDVKFVPGAMYIHNVLSPEECKQFVGLAEKMGFVDALITTGKKMVKMDIRNNKRVIWQTEQKLLNNTVYERVKSLLPEKVRGMKLAGLNERIRFYRYTGGEKFDVHYDGSYFRDKNERSWMTFIIYLNEDPKLVGGQTTFFRNYRKEYGHVSTTRIMGHKYQTIKVQPRAGSALVFFQGHHEFSPLHEGSVVESGIKYVLRSDVMYRNEKK